MSRLPSYTHFTDAELLRECDDHYADCDCPGPMQDDLYDCTEVDGVLYARPINEEEDV